MPARGSLRKAAATATYLVGAALNTTVISSTLSIVWIAWVVVNPVPTPCEVGTTRQPSKHAESEVADAVFLQHPALLSDAWALWLLPYSLKDRWRAPWWTWPLWPVHHLVGWYCVNYRSRLFGDYAAFF